MSLTQTKLAVELRPYQQQGVEWLEEHPHSILADWEGLGKTPQAAAIIAAHLPALVVARSHLCPQWFDELCTFLPEAYIHMPEGSRARIQHELDTRHAQVTIVSYDTMRNLRLPNIETLVIDEAHNIRKRDSTHSKRAVALCHTTNRAHLLTATPYYKADEDIYNLLYAVAPKQHASYWSFVREWFSVNWNAPYAPYIYGISKQKRERWLAYIAQYMLYRSYEDVGRQLPSVIERVIPFDLPTPIRQAYDTVRKKWQILGCPIEDSGSLLLTLRALTMCAPKLHAITDMVKDINGPTLVYVWYKEHARNIASRLTDPIVITGDVPIHTRHALMTQHKAERLPNPIVATIDSIGEGSNLEHIRHVIYAEETYVRGKHRQSVRRAQRDRDNDDDTAPVNVYYVRARRTIDEYIPMVRNSRGRAGELRQLTQMLASEK